MSQLHADEAGMGELKHRETLRFNMGPCLEFPLNLAQDPTEADALGGASLEAESQYVLGKLCMA